jgi:hypothetical protein
MIGASSDEWQVVRLLFANCLNADCDRSVKSKDFGLLAKQKGKPVSVTIPTRKTGVLNKWLARPGARLVQGCALSENSIVV